MPPDSHGRAAYLPAASTLVVADLHVGQGAGTPSDRLVTAVEATSPDTVVFAGDILDRFGAPSARSVETVRALASAVRAADARPVAVAGNHDGGLADAWPGPVHDAYRLDDSTLVCHGHEAPDADAERYVCGHVHPALSVEGDKWDCFLWTPSGYRDRPTLVVPAFSSAASGLRVEGREAVDSPLVSDLDSVRPGVVDGAETRWFPRLEALRSRLRRR
ncbi:metallophosphoesterase [Haloplanus sp. C73]|uniref:metallophosphoesterase n=1 Tax=Haloplanus sp. C73 TaxID=3421641 RepID=UPI003EBD09CC